MAHSSNKTGRFFKSNPGEQALDLLEIEQLDQAVNRLTQENARHRETIEEIIRTLRLRGGQDVDGLKPIEALKTILDARDKNLDLLDRFREAIKTTRSLISEGRIRDTLEYIRIFLGKPENV